MINVFKHMQLQANEERAFEDLCTLVTQYVYSDNETPEVIKQALLLPSLFYAGISTASTHFINGEWVIGTSAEERPKLIAFLRNLKGIKNLPQPQGKIEVKKLLHMYRGKDELGGIRMTEVVDIIG